MEGNSLLLLDYFLTNRHNLSIFCGYTLNKMGFCRTQSPFVSLDKPLLQGFMDTLSQILYFFVIWLAKKTHKLYDLVIYQVFTSCDTVFHENVFFFYKSTPSDASIFHNPAHLLLQSLSNKYHLHYLFNGIRRDFLVRRLMSKKDKGWKSRKV